MAKKFQKESYNPEKEQTHLNKLLVLQRNNDIIQMLLEGKDRKEIIQYITTKYRITPKSVGMYVSEARNIIDDRGKYEVNNLISIHVQRYEDIYAGLYEIKAYSLAMNSLKAKEKLLGFHKEGFHMRVNKGEMSTIRLQSVDSEYDVMKIGKEKQKRLGELIEKAKRDKNLEDKIYKQKKKASIKK